MRVAVLGTGTMGLPMARRLLGAGHELRAWNRTPERAEPLAGEGATLAGSPAEAVEGADALLTMLSDGPAVESAMRDAAGSVREGALWLQTSTVGLDAGERLAGLAREHRIALVDSPVSGTRAPAEQGQLVALAGGPQELRQRAEELLDPLTARVFWAGEGPVDGQRFKIVVNAWLIGLLGTLAESVALAERLGVDVEALLSFLDGSPVGAPYARLKGTLMQKGEYPESFRLALAAKDAGLALEAARESGLELRVLQAVAEHAAAAIAAGHGDEDMAAIVEALR